MDSSSFSNADNMFLSISLESGNETFSATNNAIYKGTTMVRYFGSHPSI
jgi:hypothetical protein